MTKDEIFHRLDRAAVDIMAMARKDTDRTLTEITSAISVRNLTEMVLMRRSYLGLLSDEVNTAQMLLLDEHGGGTRDDAKRIAAKVTEVKQNLAAIASELEGARVMKIKQLKNALT